MKIRDLEPETIFDNGGERWIKLHDPGAVSVIKVNRFSPNDTDICLTFQDVERFFYFKGKLWCKTTVNGAIPSNGQWRCFGAQEQVEAFYDRD